MYGKDMLGEAARQHFIGFIENKKFRAAGRDRTKSNQIQNAAGRANDDLLTMAQRIFVVIYGNSSSTDRAVYVLGPANFDGESLDLLRNVERGRKNQGLAGLDTAVDQLHGRDAE